MFFFFTVSFYIKYIIIKTRYIQQPVSIGKLFSLIYEPARKQPKIDEIRLKWHQETGRNPANQGEIRTETGQKSVKISAT